MLKITHKMWFALPALTLLVGLATPQGAAGQTVIIDGSTPAVGATVERKTGPSVDQLMNRSVVGADGSKIGTVTDVILDDKGEAKYIVIRSGGILGFGGKDIAADLTLADLRTGTEAIRLREVTAASIRDMPEEQISPALKRNEVDIAVGTLSEDDPEIAATALLRDKLMLVCREDHRFAKRKSVRWTELKDETLITLAAANPLRNIVEHNLLRVVPNYRPKYEVRFSTTAMSMIAAGMGVAVLPENSSQLASAVRVTTVDLIEPMVMRDVSLLQRRHHSLSPAAEHLKAVFIAYAADREALSGLAD